MSDTTEVTHPESDYFDRSPVLVSATAVRTDDGGMVITVPRHLGFKEGTVFVPRTELFGAINSGDLWDVKVTNGFALRNHLTIKGDGK